MAGEVRQEKNYEVLFQEIIFLGTKRGPWRFAMAPLSLQTNPVLPEET
jgi:hypothetical protein